MSISTITDSSFRTIYVEHYPRVRRQIYGITRDASSADDLAQDTFVRVFKNKEKFAGRAEIGTWIYRIARNIAIDYTRKRKFTLEETSETEKLDYTTPEQIAIAAQTERKFWHFLSTHRNQDYVDALLLEIKGYPRPEISSLLGVSPDSPKYLVHRMQKQVRSYLEK